MPLVGRLKCPVAGNAWQPAQKACWPSWPLPTACLPFSFHHACHAWQKRSRGLPTSTLPYWEEGSREGGLGSSLKCLCPPLPLPGKEAGRGKKAPPAHACLQATMPVCPVPSGMEQTEKPLLPARLHALKQAACPACPACLLPASFPATGIAATCPCLPRHGRRQSIFRPP